MNTSLIIFLCSGREASPCADPDAVWTARGRGKCFTGLWALSGRHAAWRKSLCLYVRQIPKRFQFCFLVFFFFWGFAQNCADIKRISMQGTFVLSKEDCCYFYPTEEKPLNVSVGLLAEWNITLENLEGTRLRAVMALISIWFTHKITVRASAVGSHRAFLTDYHEVWYVFVLCRH